MSGTMLAVAAARLVLEPAMVYMEVLRHWSHYQAARSAQPLLQLWHKLPQVRQFLTAPISLYMSAWIAVAV